jgi:hypothetical protein
MSLNIPKISKKNAISSQKQANKKERKFHFGMSQKV